MNIGIFTETYYPEINGVANSCFMLKTQLERMGHNVYVFTTKTPGEPEFEHNVFRVPSVPFIFLSDRRVGLFYQPKLASVIKKLNLDVIHTNTEFSLGIFGRIMARELSVPVVHTYHTIYEDYSHYIMKFKKLDGKTKSFIRFFTRRCCNSAKQVIVPTNKVKELLLRYRVKSNIEIVPTGINLDKFKRNNCSEEELVALRMRYGILPDEKTIIYLGRISQEKNIIEIINAMPGYMNRRKNVKMVVVGGGPDKDHLMEASRNLGIEDRVIFTGEQPWDQIGKYYQLGDVFVSASQSETQGLTYIEAMAASLPVVARKDACLDEILFDGRNGYSFVNQEELYFGLDQVLFMQNETDFASNSLEIVRKYSTEEFAYNVIKVYESVVEKENEVEGGIEISRSQVM
ncbi:MAG TPA: glycosyltransferase family 4 protein [Lachnospiraceae bacterium]|nr:glycosyltransferase family 4 protein [Lachnospiraceae bacterium]